MEIPASQNTPMFGKYQLISKIGDGGFGEVLKALDTEQNRYVALKVLHQGLMSDMGFINKAVNEAHLIEKLNHPNIVKVYEVDQISGRLYIAMEYIDGQPLSKLMSTNSTLTIQQKLNIITQIATALDATHAKKIVHRDVKPDNILVDKNGNIHLVDFGLAHAALSSIGQSSKSVGMGTAKYMSPEQAMGTTSGPAADIYSLGIIAYELFTGKTPFEADSLMGYMMAHMHQQPTDPCKFSALIPRDAGKVILRALNKNPTKRFKSAGAFARALENPPKQIKWGCIVPVAAALLLAAGGAGWYFTVGRQLLLSNPANSSIPAAAALTVNQTMGPPAQPAVTPKAPPVESPKATDIGTSDHPIKVLFVPSTDANVIVSGGKIMADALEKATGYKFEVSVPTSYAATIEEMCASPDDTIGFIPGLGYVLSNKLCGVDAAFKAVRFGSSYYWAEIIVKRDSNFKIIKDLEGKKWGYGDVGSTSGYMVPLAMFKEASINPGDRVATGGHPQSVKAVYNGEVDFATVFFTPASVPEGAEKWKEGADPDIPEDLVKQCKVSDDRKKLMCGGYKVNDARANIREEAPDVIEKVKILAVSPAIPNDTMSFGPKFPTDVREKVSKALVEFAKTDAWKESIGKQDFYAWDGITETKDEEFDFVRQMVEAAGITLESFGK